MPETAHVLREVFAGIFGVIGVLFFMVGALGIIRMPDVFTRLHPATKCDTLGAASITLALCIHSGFTFESVKLLIILFFLMLSSATAAHAISRSAFLRGLRIWTKEKKEVDAE